MRTVAVLGGSFDPPTRAHTTIPLAVSQAIGADWLLVIPAAVSPFKRDGSHASDEQRLAMLRLALAEHPRVAISAIEIERGGTSYTVETLRELRWRFPAIVFRLLIGADQAASFHRWREPHAILDLAEPAVMLRGDVNADALLESMAPHWSAGELAAWRARIIAAPTLDASSTEARALLRVSPRDEVRLRGLLDPRVLEYITREGLYGSGVAS
ncbi:MAG: nicotinate (nicotinamide) nucleotide adenylyltransferase [Phycisphaeraceae bacterium]|nr:nicotinate (nicotinamide) nucleotide adenylyltransferase [Phycisphaeraceae bacterium]